MMIVRITLITSTEGRKVKRTTGGRRRVTVAAATLAAVLAAIMVPVAANAEEAEPDPLQVLEAVTAQDHAQIGEASDVLENVSSATRLSSDGAVHATEGDVQVAVPAESGTPLQVGDAGVLLPFSDARARAEVLEPGVVAFDNGNGTTTVPVVKNDGSVQVTTIIASPAAPQEFAYGLSLPDDAAISIDDSGVVLVTSGDTLVLGVAPPWAVDATGAQVPTHYDLRGNILVQVVDHTSASFEYPVVADPWLGAALFGSVFQNSSTQKITGAPTAWGTAVQSGVAVGGWAIGQTIMKTAGWDEWANKAPLSRTKATYHQQFDCHVVGAYTPVTGGPTWDLEGWRANRPNWLVDGGAYPYKCNWP